MFAVLFITLEVQNVLRLFHSTDHVFVLEGTGTSRLNENCFKYVTCMFFTTFDFPCVTLAKSASLCLNFRGETIEVILTALFFCE